LQANIDLVNTLESALNDSERNLRKSRMQMSELTKARDSLQAANESLRQQLQDVTDEVESVRSSLIDSQRESDSRLAAERRAKEAARQQLEARMEGMRGRKNKFKYGGL
jgi:chromosome segregation ATPase